MATSRDATGKLRTGKPRRNHNGAAAAAPWPASKLGSVDQAARVFMAAAMQAREVRVTRIAPAADGAEGWEVEADILVPDLAIKRLGLPLRQAVLEARRCTVHLDAALMVKSYQFDGEAEG